MHYLVVISLSLAAAEPLEVLPSLLVDLVGEPAGRRGRRRVRHEVSEERPRGELRHLDPGAPSTVVSEETSSTCSRERCLAASRSSMVSASAAKRTASGPRSTSSPIPSKTSIPRAPRTATKLARQIDELASVARRAGVEEVVTVEEVERWARRSARAALPQRLEQEHRRGHTDVQRLDRPLERDRHQRVEVRRTSGRSPFPSAPSASATPPVRSVLQRSEGASPAAP